MSSAISVPKPYLGVTGMNAYHQVQFLCRRVFLPFNSPEYGYYIIIAEMPRKLKNVIIKMTFKLENVLRAYLQGIMKATTSIILVQLTGYFSANSRGLSYLGYKPNDSNTYYNQ
jgi:hypothetical protein